MLTFRQPRELLLLHFAGHAPPLCKLTLPLAAHTLAFGVVALLGVGKLLFVIRLSLPRADRFGECHHVRLLEIWMVLAHLGRFLLLFLLGGLRRLSLHDRLFNGEWDRWRCQFRWHNGRHLSFDELLGVARKLDVRQALSPDKIAVLHVTMQRVKAPHS